MVMPYSHWENYDFIQIVLHLDQFPPACLLNCFGHILSYVVVVPNLCLTHVVPHF